MVKFKNLICDETWIYILNICRLVTFIKMVVYNLRYSIVNANSG